MQETPDLPVESESNTKIELTGHVGPCKRFMGTYKLRTEKVNMFPSYVMATKGAKYFMYRTPTFGGSINDSYREHWFVSDTEPPSVTIDGQYHRPFISTCAKSELPTDLGMTWQWWKQAGRGNNLDLAIKCTKVSALPTTTTIPLLLYRITCKYIINISTFT